jgi:UDP-glucose:(glucosyl)LPS alpha-1,2-glucosyltransferase
MSTIYKGQILDTTLSRSAMGGTEQMRTRLINAVDKSLLSDIAIHFSRVREIFPDVPNILYCHDTAEDPENKLLESDGWSSFSKLVFVSYHQRDAYIARFGIPYSKCTVIQNAIEPADRLDKSTEQIKLIYHTTPHRGLELLYPVYAELSKMYGNKLHLDVFSSFAVYGWNTRDQLYAELFEKLDLHPHITYHGAQPNSVVRDYLSRAHYFPYPCIWKETSCIALIEAIEHNVVAIHPTYGALPETAGGNTFMYEYTEKLQDHLNLFYSIMTSVIANDLRTHKLINKNPNHNIQMFTSKWTKLLKEFI